MLGKKKILFSQENGFVGRLETGNFFVRPKSFFFFFFFFSIQVFILPSELRSEGLQNSSPAVGPSIHDEELHSTIESCSRDANRGTDSFSFFWIEQLASESQTKKMR